MMLFLAKVLLLLALSLSPSQPHALNGCAAQEDRLWVASNFPATGVLYNAVISVAQNKCIIMGSPTSVITTQDWTGNGIEYGEFTNGYHTEMHADNVVRFYNQQNVTLYTFR